MADRILLKRSLTAGSVPTTSSLELGELAVNVADGKIFLRESGSIGDIIATFSADSDSFRIVSGSVSASVNVTGDIFFVRSGSINLLSVSSTGTTTVSGSANDLFFVKGIANKTILTVSQSGVVVFATQSVTPSGTAPNGGLTFTSTDFFVGLD
jgi:hypothetical protein